MSFIEAFLFWQMGAAVLSYGVLRRHFASDDAACCEELDRAIRQAFGDFSD